MKYCSSCKSIVEEIENGCPSCGGNLCEISQDATVTVAQVKGTALNVLEPAMKDAGIPCIFEQTDSNVYNAYNVKISAESIHKVLVPFEMYNKAFDVCLGFGFVSPEDRLVPEQDDEKEEDSRTYNEKFESKTGVKHRTWQMLSIVLFVVAACLVIWGVDYLAAFIKSLF